MIRYSKENLPPVGKEVEIRPVIYLASDIYAHDRKNVFFNRRKKGVVISYTRVSKIKGGAATYMITNIVPIKMRDGSVEFVSSQNLIAEETGTEKTLKASNNSLNDR